MVKLLRSLIVVLVVLPATGLAQFEEEKMEFYQGTFDVVSNSLSKSIQADVATAQPAYSEKFYSPSLSYIMYAAYAEGNDIYLGGTARYLGKTQINSITRYVGGNWLPMGSGFNGSVVKIDRINGQLYAGGGFTTTGSGVEMKRFARWNGNAWEQVGPGLDDFVYNFIEFDGAIYIGVANGVFRWDGSTMERIITTFSYVDALAVFEGDLYIGGAFQGTPDAAISYVARWDGTELHPVGQGSFSGPVRALTVYDGYLVAGGLFIEVNGEPVSRLAKYKDGIWSPLDNAPEIHSGVVLGLRTIGSDLYAVGNFSTSRGQHAIKYNEQDWAGLGFLSTTVWDIANSGNMVYLVGNFAASENPRVSYVTAYDGTRQASVPGMPVNTTGLGAGGDVYTVAARFNSVFMGGFFFNAGSNSAFTFARLVDNDWVGGFNFSSPVDAIHFQAGQGWIVGGRFSQISGNTFNRVARFTGDNTFEPIGDGFGDGIVYDLNEFENAIIAAGTFTMSGDGSRVLNRIARWNGSHWEPMGQGFNGPVLKTHVFNGELYASGAFTMSDSNPVKGIARWNGTQWIQVGDADSPFLSDSILQVWALNDFNGQLVAGRVNSPSDRIAEPIGAVATLNPDGVWEKLGHEKIFGTVFDIERVGNSLFIGGTISNIDNRLINLIQFDRDGLHYVGNPNRTVWSVTHSGNALWLGGSFDQIDGLPTSQVAAIENFELYPIGLTSDAFVVTLGDTLEIDVYVGSPGSQISNLSGVGFQLVYDENVFGFVSAQAAGLFNNQTDLEFVDTSIDGTVAMAVSKTGSATSQGNGVVARVRLVVEDVEMFYHANFHLRDYEARNTNGDIVILDDRPLSVNIFELAVWPGDTNNDGMVNQNDVLTIGQYFGVEGPARAESSVFFEPKAASRWFIDGEPSMAVYADATGDGRVNQNDVLPVGINFGRSSSMRKAASVQFEPLTRVTIPSVEAGESYRVTIQLSDEGLPPILGIAGSATFTSADISLQNFLVTGDILPANPNNLIIFFDEDEDTGTISFVATRRAQDGPVDFGASMAVIEFTSTVDITEPFEVILNEAAYSTMTTIVKNPGVSVAFEQIVSIETGGIDIPVAYGLDQNFPNPFNPTTSITYHTPASGDVRLSVFDMLGREVAVLVNGSVNAGTHVVNFDARSLSSGMYIYRLKAGNQVITKKMTLVK